MAPRNEPELLAQTIDLAKLNRWAVMHQRPALTRAGWRTAIQGHIGFPDLVLARGGTVLFRELKSARGRLTPEQLDWARQLSGDPHWAETRLPGDQPYRSTLLFDIWRPADFLPLIIPLLTRRTA
jgi:hypothetical protein